jgi:multiple sugar transport system permease protein
MPGSSTVPASSTRPEGRPPLLHRLGVGRWRAEHQNEGYLFILPSFIGFIAFVVAPIIGSLVLSFHRWDLLTPPQFVAFDNYVELADTDPLFGQVLVNTFFYMLTIAPLQLVAGFFLATLLDSGIRGHRLYRLIHFMPVVTNAVAAALVFQFLLNRDIGVLAAWIWNLAEITGLPVQPPDWLNDPRWAKPGVVLFTLWKNTGFTMVMYLAALRAVPEVLYEAAKVDGANAWQRLRRITIPMVSPTTFFLLVIQMLGAFQIFAEPFVMTSNTQGQLPKASLSIVIYLYQNAFQFQRMGKAAAIAWVLFAIVLVLTFFQIRFQRRWVHYETE